MRRSIAALAAAAALCVAPPALGSDELVPAYFYPSGTPNPWQEMCAAIGTPGGGSVAILNPANGPGREADANYAAALSYCHERAWRVVGYVYTKYGRRSTAQVEKAINSYYSFYPAIDGIFLDEMAESPTARAKGKMTAEGYYRTLYGYIHGKSAAAEVIGNPGTSAATAWQLQAPAADDVVTFEGSSAAYETYVAPGWVLGAPAEKIANIVYGAPSGSLAGDCARAASENAGLRFVTNLEPPNPYEALPAYWAAESESC